MTKSGTWLVCSVSARRRKAAQTGSAATPWGTGPPAFAFTFMFAFMFAFAFAFTFAFTFAFAFAFAFTFALRSRYVRVTFAGSPGASLSGRASGFLEGVSAMGHLTAD